MRKPFGGEGARFFKETRGAAAEVARRRWLGVVFLIGAGFAVGALATAFADLLSRLVNEFGEESPLRWFDPIIPVREGEASLSSLLFELPIVRTPAGALAACGLLALVLAGLAFATGRQRARISADIYQRLRREAFDRCLDGEIPVDEIMGGEKKDGPVNLATALNRGAYAVSNTYTYILNSGQQVLSIVTAFITTGRENLPVTAACVVVVLLQVAIANVQARRLRRRREAFDENLNALQARTADLLAARELLLAFDKADFYKLDLREQVEQLSDLQYRNETSEVRYRATYELIEKWGQLFVITAIVGLAVALGTLIDQDDSPLVFALTFYSTLLPNARGLIAAYDAMKRTEAVVSSFLRLIGAGPADGVAKRRDGWLPSQPIRFENVSFRYLGCERPVLSGLSVSVPAQSTTLLLGPSGCGKSTIGKLALRFLRPEAGSVAIGGGPVDQWSLPYLHSFMSYGPQNDHIFDATVRENLRLAEDGEPLSDERLLEALDTVRLRLGGGRERLDLRAKQLSGGEIQRLSAARILLDRAEIIILDEPMAGVDLFTLADIAPAVERHWKDSKQTVLLISHKLVFGSIASWIVILDEKGKVVEQGRPADLLATEGAYVRLRREALRQAGG